MASVLVAGTLDTKAEEVDFIHAILSARHSQVARVDLSTRPGPATSGITATTVAAHHPGGAAAVFDAPDRGGAVAAMQVAFERYCRENAPSVAAIIGVGGGGGTAMITAGMRQLPYGVPKIMVSTLASGDVAPYVGTSDIAMFSSVTDVAGLNRLSRVILSNAANALAGMIAHPPRLARDDKPAVGLTMFGVTTTAVEAISARLKPDFDCLIFHATGTGGRTMERLADQRLISGILDITTTEIADLLVGGVLAAGPDRLDVIARRKIPYVGSVGALDMVNFWAPGTVPAAFTGRRFHHHNSNVTLMRTTAQDCTGIGAWIGAKLNACAGPVRLLIPEKGISALDIDGGPFHDPAADAALFDALSDAVHETAERRIIRLPCHINDPAFADAAVAEFRAICHC